MIPNAQPHSLRTSNGTRQVAEFGLSIQDSAHLMEILRSTLYTDRILAVLREYSSNAWDAHRDAGKPDLPIEVKLPTMDDPTLRIRDFGHGLSPDDIVQVYTQYGASTKRGSNATVGSLGLGCKSAFAYADSFVVTSWHGGMRRTYSAALDKTNTGVMVLLNETPCGAETGVEIQVAVKRDDICSFEQRAHDLFQHYEPQPVINTWLQRVDAVKLPSGSIRKQAPYQRKPWIAVMGCVPYQVDVSKVLNDSVDPDFARAVEALHGVLRFEIGEVETTASREGLRYSPETAEAVLARMEQLLDEYVAHLMAELESSAASPWLRVLKAYEMTQLHLPLPIDFGPCKEATVLLPLPDGYSLLSHEHEERKRISISPETRLLVLDDRRRLGGFDLQRHDFVVRAPKQVLAADARVALDQAVAAVKLTGVPITLLSTIPWSPRTRNGRPHSVKHRARMFRLLPGAWRYPFSAAWEPVKRVPQPDDVFVVLDQFRAVGHYGRFYDSWWHDQELAEAWSAPLPEIYGYKHTEKKPVDVNACVGVPYDTWRARFVESLQTPQAVSMLDAYSWAMASHGSRDAQLAHLLRELGPAHALIEMFLAMQAGMVAWQAFSVEQQTAVRRLTGRSERPRVADVTISGLKERYPCFAEAPREFNVLLSQDDSTARAWIEYVQAIDLLAATRRMKEEAA